MFENEGSENLESTESESPEADASGSDAADAKAQALIDLDTVDRFKFAGREWTPKDFQGAYMMQSDYTRKTQALSEERKYYDNLSHDLRSVKANPALAADFKRVYPEKYHAYLEYVTQAQSSNQAQGMPQQSNQQNQSSIDPQFMERFTRLESELNERKVEAASAEIDAKFKTLGEKFPYADEEAVIARAQALLERGDKLTDKVWESLFQTVHDRYKGMAEKHYSEQFKKQQSSNLKGRDVAAGGGTPGKAPKMPRTIKEASAFALQEIENQ